MILASALLVVFASGGVAATASSQRQVAPQATTTLKVFDEEVGSVGAAYEELNRLFEKRHPNVKLERSSLTFSAYIKVLPLRLKSPNPPDVFEGYQSGPLVKAKLLRPLTSYARKYGWLTRFGPPSILDQLRFTADGAMGSGILYGLAQQAEVLGFYYNKAILAKLGLRAPKTFPAFEHVLAAAKKAGETPIMDGGNQTSYAVVQSLMLLLDQGPSRARPAKLNAWVYGKPGRSIVDARSIAGAATLKEWADAGYFPEGFTGLSDEDAKARFTQGEGLFTLSGPWDNPAFSKALGKKLGFIVLPPQAGQSPASTGSFGQPWHISTASENADVAAQYIDFMTSAASANIMARKYQLLPANAVIGGSGARQSSFAQILSQWKALTGAGNLVLYLGMSTPTMLDTLLAATSELIAGKITAKQCVQRLQADWRRHHG
jgi:raffinose/stachyose/melibiose transport system substrate-binding protein